MLAAVAAGASPVDVANLAALARRTAGRADVIVGLIDGPVATDHPDLAGARIHRAKTSVGDPTEADGAARSHGTFIAGILSARRKSSAPAICPECSLLVRPIFLGAQTGRVDLPTASSDELAAAIIDCVEAGALILNLSLAVAQPSVNKETKLEEALSHAARRNVIVVAAAGNQGTLGGTAITRHPWVIPVAACDAGGWPMAMSNFGSSIGRRGLMAPGDAITSLDAAGGTATSGGTSVAVPFVTGAVALLWSAFPQASAGAVRSAITATGQRRRSVVPPILDGEAAYQRLAADQSWSRSAWLGSRTR